VRAKSYRRRLAVQNSSVDCALPAWVAARLQADQLSSEHETLPRRSGY
jgi:hypothetical protein